MSELKAYRIKGVTLGDFHDVYLKSEADKVIAELKRQIEFLKVTTDSCKNCAQCADGMGKVFDKEFNPLKDKLRSQKYKRCLAMAKWCDEVMMSCELRGYAVHRIWANKHQWAMRWKYRWLSIAEKFKEAK